jgi:chemotaxis protein MotB
MTEENKNLSISSFEEGEHDTDTSGLWIVPYADFMTVMMIFFLLMFAFAYASKTDKKYKKIMSDIQTEMGGEVNKELIEKMIEQEKTDQLASKFDDVIGKENLSKYITVNTSAEQIKIVFSNPILFDPGKVDLKQESIKILHEIALILKETNNEVIVEGHTDNIPITGGLFKSNWELSVARGMEVIRYFIDKEGLRPERFASAGYGEFRPVLSNDTEENRAQNRRIEINILRNSEILPTNVTSTMPVIGSQTTQ